MAEVRTEGFHPWHDVALKPNHNLAIEYDIGYLVAKVKRRTVLDLIYDLYGALGANPGTFPAASIYNFQIIFDNRVPPREILQHRRPMEVWQIFASLNHPDARFYLNCPQSTRTRGFNSKLGSAAVNFQDPFGWLFEGRDSDIDDPTDAGEFFLPAYDDCEVALVNTVNYVIRPQSRFVFNQIELQPLDVTNESDRRIIAGIFRQSIPARFWNRDNVPYPRQIDQFYGDYKVPPVLFDGAHIGYKDKEGIDQWVGVV